MGSLVAELAEKLSSATNNLDFDEQTMFLNTSADTVGIGTNAPASKLDVRGTVQVGVNDVGHDVKFFGDTASRYWLWDTSADGVVQLGTLTVGVNDAGHDVKFFGATSGKYMEWDESADQLDVTGSFDVTGNSTMVGTLTVGVNDTGHDVIFYGAAAGAMMMWDESADSLLVRGATADHATNSAGRIVLQTAQIAVGDNDILGRIDFQAPLEDSGTDAWCRQFNRISICNEYKCSCN